MLDVSTASETCHRRQRARRVTGVSVLDVSQLAVLWARRWRESLPIRVATNANAHSNVVPIRDSPTTGKHNVAFVRHPGCPPVAETVLRFSLPAAAPLTRFHPQTVCTIIVFSLSNSAGVIFELTMVINQVIWRLIPEATLSERQKSLHMGTHAKPPNHNAISCNYNRCTIR